jgi:DNA repair ATPase RecN
MSDTVSEDLTRSLLEIERLKLVEARHERLKERYDRLDETLADKMNEGQRLLSEIERLTAMETLARESNRLACEQRDKLEAAWKARGVLLKGLVDVISALRPTLPFVSDVGKISTWWQETDKLVQLAREEIKYT